MPIQRLKQYLDDNQVRYVSIRHSPAYTAHEIAASAHVPGDELAKTVMVKVDGDMAMAVLPASYQVDLKLLRDLIGARKVELATEDEFRGLFPGCELGAMPPFGNLYDLPVFAAEMLADHDEIAFNAGSHTELIRLAYREFHRLVEPHVLEFAARA